MATTLKSQQAFGGDGWQSANETWTYSSVDAPTGVITIPTDGTTKYSVGMRVKFTQTTVKYGIITAIAATTMTIYTGTGTALTNAAISANFYSSQKAPLGFPLDPTVWTVEVSDTNNNSQSSPTAATWYNIGSISITIPIGVWRVTSRGIVGIARAAGSCPAYGALSTANNSASDADMSMKGFAQSITDNQIPIHIEKNISLATKTVYYWNSMTDTSGVTTLTNFNGQAKLILRATCAYL